MCPSDGFVCFRNSQLLTGRLGKGTLGDGNKDGLFHVRLNFNKLLVVNVLAIVECPQ